MEEKVLNLPGQHPAEVTEDSADRLKVYEPIIRKAVSGGLFFYSKASYFDLWLSPREFENFVRQGSMWIERKWILKDPKVRIMEIERDIFLLREELRSFQSEISEMNNDNSVLENKN